MERTRTLSNLTGDVDSPQRGVVMQARERRTVVVMLAKNGSWGWQIAHMHRVCLADLDHGKPVEKSEITFEGQFNPVAEDGGTAMIEASRIAGLLALPALGYFAETVQTKTYCQLKPPANK